MVERLLIVPAWWFSPRAIEAIPASVTSLGDLRARFDVEIFAWPCVRGGAEVGPDWRDIVRVLVDRVDPRTHLVVIGAPAIGIMVASLGTPRSFISSGVYAPAATLAALGDSAGANYRIRPFLERSHFVVQQILKGASEDKVRQVTEIIDADVDWKFALAVNDSYQTLNLVAERARVTLPTLYLSGGVEEAIPAAREGFALFVPNLEFRQLHLWPERMDQAEAGREFARHVIEYTRTLDPLPADTVSGPSPGARVFRRDGEYWSIAFASEAFRLKDSKGLRYLAHLLANPGADVHPLELVAGGEAAAVPVGGTADVELASTEGGAGAMLDAEARAAYREHLGDLSAEVDEAEAWNDPERAAKARTEMQFITRELAAALGIGGRVRQSGDPAERARQSVTKAVKGAISRIDEHAPKLSRHLSDTIHTGMICRYAPDPGVSASWNF